VYGEWAYDTINHFACNFDNLKKILSPAKVHDKIVMNLFIKT